MLEKRGRNKRCRKTRRWMRPKRKLSFSVPLSEPLLYNRYSRRSFVRLSNGTSFVHDDNRPDTAAGLPGMPIDSRSLYFFGEKPGTWVRFAIRVYVTRFGSTFVRSARWKHALRSPVVSDSVWPISGLNGRGPSCPENSQRPLRRAANRCTMDKITA